MTQPIIEFRGQAEAFFRDNTRAIDLEGAFRSGKTTVALWKVWRSCLEHPGIAWLVCRYSDGDTQSKLKPPWREILHKTATPYTWDPHAQCDTFGNGSKVYMFGLKAQDQAARYAKLRGITLAGIYCDQAEELPRDVFLEFMGRLSQRGHPHQVLLTPNPPDENHWLCQEFPEDNHILGRRYYSVPIYANSHNLPDDTIRELEIVYPLGHAKHRSAILGLRGPSVIGDPVYGPSRRSAGSFRRDWHVGKVEYIPRYPLYEAIDFGKHHPCVVWAQFHSGGMVVLGGLLGQDMFLEDFAPRILQARADWFPDRYDVQTCCDPAGSHQNSQGVRWNGIKVLEEHGIHPVYKDNSNAPDVRYALIQRLAAYMRKRTSGGGESFIVCDNDPSDPRWLLVSDRGSSPRAFVADGLEAGYVWDGYISVGSKQVLRPLKDGWYEHGMNCLEYLELNFGGAQPSLMQMDRLAEKLANRAVRRSQRDDDPFRWGQERYPSGRAGY